MDQTQNKYKALPTSVVRGEYHVLTQDYTEALVLSQMDYWQRAKSDHTNFMIVEIQRMNGVECGFGAQEWFYKSIRQLREELFYVASKDKIWKAIKSLVEKGYLFTRKGDSKSFDRASYYRINLAKMEMELREKGLHAPTWDIEKIEVSLPQVTSGELPSESRETSSERTPTDFFDVRPEDRSSVQRTRSSAGETSITETTTETTRELSFLEKKEKEKNFFSELDYRQDIDDSIKMLEIAYYSKMPSRMKQLIRSVMPKGCIHISQVACLAFLRRFAPEKLPTPVPVTLTQLTNCLVEQLREAYEEVERMVEDYDGCAYQEKLLGNLERSEYISARSDLLKDMLDGEPLACLLDHPDPVEA